MKFTSELLPKRPGVKVTKVHAHNIPGANFFFLAQKT